MAGSIKGVARNQVLAATKTAQKGYSSNVPRYRDDPIGSTGQRKTKNTTGPTGSAGSTGSTGSTGTSGGGGNSALLAYMQALEARQRQAANDAYNKNVSAMKNAFAERGKLMENNLNTTLQNLQTDYDASKANVNKDAQNSLQQAYINNMMSRKNLNQNMAAQGLSGGASETTMAGMYNNYGNARNNIQTVANDNLGELENLYNKNRNSAYQAYNDQLAQDAIAKAQYMAQFEADRQNALATAYNTQLSQLMSLDPTYAASMLGLVDNQAGYTYEGTKADNTPDVVSVEQGIRVDDAGLSNAQRLNYARKVLANGGDAEDIIRGLSYTTSSQTLQSILSQLGLA